LPADIKNSSSLELARFAATLAEEKLATDIVVLDLRPVTDFADFMVICTGVVDVHVRAIADHVDDELHKRGVHARHIEGSQSGRWILIDYFDVVVNVFLPEARTYYALERLWGDAPLLNAEQPE